MSHSNPIWKRSQRRRGSALVEFSILTMALVPLILLPMYFQDVLRFKLDAQEAVASTTWDFAFADYVNNSAGSLRNSYESAARARYANLWPGNKKEKADDQKAGPWADFRWAGGKEVTCSVDKEFASDPYSSLGLINLAQHYHDEYTKGGLISCTGTIEVTNHYVPKSFTQDFNENELFEFGEEPLMLDEEKFAVMVDPWTIHDPAEVTDGDEGNEDYYERVKFVFEDPMITYWGFTGLWYMYILKLLPKLSITAAVWDDPSVVKLAVQHYPDSGNVDPSQFKSRSVDVSGGRSNFYTTPFGDPDPVKGYKETFEKRNIYYMGCDSFGPDCN